MIYSLEHRLLLLEDPQGMNCPDLNFITTKNDDYSYIVIPYVQSYKKVRNTAQTTPYTKRTTHR